MQPSPFKRVLPLSHNTIQFVLALMFHVYIQIYDDELRHVYKIYTLIIMKLIIKQILNRTEGIFD